MTTEPERPEKLVLCLTCKIEKPVAQMARARQYPKGYSSQCRTCKNLAKSDYKRAHPQETREYDRALYLKNAEQRAKDRSRYDKEHPGRSTARAHAEYGTDKEKARRALKAAVRYGRISKPSDCQDCGHSGGLIHGHHHDYTKPFDVEWLCPRCHGVRHRLPDVERQAKVKFSQPGGAP